MSLSKNINPSLVLVQPRKTRLFITERLLIERKELNKQTKQQHSSKYFACRPPTPTCKWGQKVKIQLFQNMVMLHIKLNGITNSATWSQIFCLQAPTFGQTSTFSEHGHERESRMQQHGSQYFACRLFQNMVMLHIKLKRITNAAGNFNCS